MMGEWMVMQEALFYELASNAAYLPATSCGLSTGSSTSPALHAPQGKRCRRRCGAGIAAHDAKGSGR